MYVKADTGALNALAIVSLMAMYDTLTRLYLLNLPHSIMLCNS